ncbi:hypothetical protein MKEN_01041600 [Mycena kentingensis (nom. inval.)]|nr:hypothetical protein MKEN_01041600 [Mycena kentingensis (nom. inval.)]
MSELYATADFCLIPIGTETTSVAEYIAECSRILEKSGLVYKVCRSQYTLGAPLSPNRCSTAPVSSYIARKLLRVHVQFELSLLSTQKVPGRQSRKRFTTAMPQCTQKVLTASLPTFASERVPTETPRLG